jgi:hypothetical protein
MEEKYYEMGLTKVTGMVILAQTSTKVLTGTKEQLEDEYKKALAHNLTLGWWSVFSIVWLPLALYRNYKNLQTIRSL